MILRRTRPYDPLCERCLKLTRVTRAIVAFELAPDAQTLMDTPDGYRTRSYMPVGPSRYVRNVRISLKRTVV
jgi:hypothetical protein